MNFFDRLLAAAPAVAETMSADVKLYIEALRTGETQTQSTFTDNGKMILKYLQDNMSTTLWKSRDIAEGLVVSSRTVSGACRKLASDGYVEKMGKDPVLYCLTEKGKNITID